MARKASAVAGLRHAGFSLTARRRVPSGIRISTARSTISTAGKRSPSRTPYDNAFKRQWELFLRHLVKGEQFPWDLLEGAKGVQLAEKGIESWQKRCWVDVPKLNP